jgi:hypothetical protein
MSSAGACASPIICTGPAGESSAPTSTSSRPYLVEDQLRREKRSERKAKRKTIQAKAKAEAKDKQTSTVRYYVTYVKLKTISKLQK